MGIDRPNMELIRGDQGIGRAFLGAQGNAITSFLQILQNRSEGEALPVASSPTCSLQRAHLADLDICRQPSMWVDEASARWNTGRSRPSPCTGLLELAPRDAFPASLQVHLQKSISR